MFPLNTGSWIAIALLMPFWQALGLFILALLSDVSPRWRRRVSPLFDWLERRRVDSPDDTAFSLTVAA
jgi:hypothetical protein